MNRSSVTFHKLESCDLRRIRKGSQETNRIKFSNLFARAETRITRINREFSRFDLRYAILVETRSQKLESSHLCPPDNGRLFEIRSIVLIETEPCVIASCGCYNYRYVSDIAYCGVHKSWEKTDRHNEF